MRGRDEILGALFRQLAAVDIPKATVLGFTALRRLAMRFRVVLRGHNVGQLERWLQDADAQ